MKDDVEAEVAAIVAWLRDGAWKSWDTSNGLRWWQVRLRFANRIAAIAQNKVATAIERGDYRTYLEAPKHPDRESDSE